MADRAFLKLRANLRMGSDLELARREAARYLGRIRPVPDRAAAARLGGLAGMAEAVRPGSPVGFVGDLGAGGAAWLLAEAAFVQELWRRTARGWERDIPRMARAELGLMDGASPDPHAAQRPTSAPHVHGIHKYKARFFPRLARFLVAEHLPRAAAGGGGGVTLDPFAGGGTLPVEASLLGHRAIGVDIDALSCRIAATKLALLHPGCPVAAVDLEQLAGELPPGGARARYRLPPWIRGKLERAGRGPEASTHEARIGALSAHVRRLPRKMQGVAALALSDALTRKFNVRMLGTGVGRFALDVGRGDLGTLMARALRQMAAARRVAPVLGERAPAAIIRGDATRLPLPPASVDLVVTSPPYLPASSGRENYLIGKSVALTALGILSVDEIRALEGRSVGSMSSPVAPSARGLPEAALHLVRWLAADPLRSIKAAPTLAYYDALRAALAECRRVLRPGGHAVFVIGKESVFYRFRDRQVLYRVRCDAIFSELAAGAGFTVDGQQDLELDKGHRNARPRSLDPYFEAIIVLTPKPGRRG